MFGQIAPEVLLFIMLYAAAAAVAAMACCYLLLRRGNAFASDVTSPVRLRRWTAVFFAMMALSHVWYLPSLLSSSAEVVSQSLRAGALLDFLTVFPLAVVVMLCMLQDRRRPLWVAHVSFLPLVATMAECIVSHSDDILKAGYVYLMLLGVGLTVYMVRATRQYGRWLRDNYADLEHKEVWQSLVVLAVILLMFGFYTTGMGTMTYEFTVQVCCILLVGYLLWRVETLSDLTLQPPLLAAEVLAAPANKPAARDTRISLSSGDIAALLEQYCVSTQLYLHHDLTVSQLAMAIGSNRTYLSRYFAAQDTTYNAYINNLRIQHFVSLYRQAVASGQSVRAQQLAHASGYHSYSTFSLAFKQRMGQSVTAWMHENNR